MARREPKLISVMMRIEPSLDHIFAAVLAEDDDTASTFMRTLLIKELQRRGKISQETLQALVGAGC